MIMRSLTNDGSRSPCGFVLAE